MGIVAISLSLKVLGNRTELRSVSDPTGRALKGIFFELSNFRIEAISEYSND